MKKEISLTQHTLAEASAIIDGVLPQRHQAQAARETLGNPLTVGHKIDFQESGKQQKRAERIPEGGRYPLQCFENAWPECFFTHHDCAGKDDVPAIEARKVFGCVEDELTSFLGLFDDLASPCEVGKVKRYCEGGASLEEVQNGMGEAGTRRAAWVDDRNSLHLKGSGRARPSGKLLTATGLLRHLKKPVWTSSDIAKLPLQDRLLT